MDLASATLLAFPQLQLGTSAKVVRIDSPGPNEMRLQEMGLTIGTSFRVVKVAPLGDPIEIHVRGSRLCLRKAETAAFWVSEEPRI
jgi:ferrous iron transport protein A